MKRVRRPPRVWSTERKANEFVRFQVAILAGSQKPPWQKSRSSNSVQKETGAVWPCHIRNFTPSTTTQQATQEGERWATEANSQALVYDILPSTTAVFSYVIGSRKLSANEQFFFFFGAQTVVSLLQTTQIISDVCFITDHVAYASSNQTKIV